jgi:hypothetical protein
VSGKAGLIAAGIAATVALGTGGYYANEQRVCRNLERTFLTETAAVLTNLQSSKVAAAVDARAALELRSMQLLEPANRTYFTILDRCGEEAGKSAMEHALDLRDEMASPAI